MEVAVRRPFRMRPRQITRSGAMSGSPGVARAASSSALVRRLRLRRVRRREGESAMICTRSSAKSAGRCSLIQRSRSRRSRRLELSRRKATRCPSSTRGQDGTSATHAGASLEVRGGGGSDAMSPFYPAHPHAGGGKAPAPARYSLGDRNRLGKVRRSSSKSFWVTSIEYCPIRRPPATAPIGAGIGEDG